MITCEPCFCEEKVETQPIKLYFVVYDGDGRHHRNAIVHATSEEDAIEMVDNSFDFIAFEQYFKCREIDVTNKIVMTQGKIQC